MRYCTYESPDGPRPGILPASSILLDVRAIDPGLEGSLLRLAADPELSLRFLAAGHAEPPVGTVLRAEGIRFLAPFEPGRIALAGEEPEDLLPQSVVGPDGALPEGAWRAGVGAVVRHRVRDVGDGWHQHLIGFVPFHIVGKAACVGPWIVGMHEILAPGDVGFSAFVNDELHARNPHMDIDWDALLTAAHQRRTLRAGDIVGIAAPARQASGELRCALTCRGTVMARLEATAGPHDAVPVSPDTASDAATSTPLP